ncbi:unnamed protein product, partial [Staurois parvus]
QRVGDFCALYASACTDPALWPTISWLSCCCSQLLPLCYNTTNCGIFSSKEISWMDLLHRWQPITLEFTELLTATHSFTNVCRSSLHA